MRGNAEELGQLDLALGVSDFVADNGVAQLSDEIGKSLAALDDKGQVTRARARLDADGSDARQFQGVRVEGIKVNEIHAQIRNEQELSRGVKNRLVRVRRILAIRIGWRAGQLVVDGLEQLQIGGIGHIPCGEGRATAVFEEKIPVSKVFFLNCCAANRYVYLLVSHGQTMAVVAKHNAAYRATGCGRLAELLQTAITSSLEGCQRTTGRVQALVDAVQDGIVVVQSQPRRVIRAALRHRHGAELLDARVLPMSVVEGGDGLRVRRDVDQAGRGEIAGAEQGRDQALWEITTTRHCIKGSID